MKDAREVAAAVMYLDNPKHKAERIEQDRREVLDEATRRLRLVIGNVEAIRSDLTPGLALAIVELDRMWRSLTQPSEAGK